ncbi:MAG: glycoside hydrolase family 9 protein [Polyangiaceae bacterium]|jgi:hypothetical protein
MTKSRISVKVATVGLALLAGVGAAAFAVTRSLRSLASDRSAKIPTRYGDPLRYRPASEGLDGPIAGPLPPLSSNITVDQFGYLPSSEKIAVVRVARVGFDADTSFTPGSTYALVDARTRETVFTASPTRWNGGATDPTSGDQVWWFDFSTVSARGDYFVIDESRGVRSPLLTISKDVYRRVLAASMRMFYYQRDGLPKEARFAGSSWQDGVAHPQDKTCEFFADGSAVRDLHGGWFDAGDQNRYTSWGASDVIELLHAYREAPAAFPDDDGIPESGNGVPDVLDEAKWELDWIVRMQADDGSLLSVVDHRGASPPSADRSPCRYGPASTSATLAGAAALAFGSVVLGSVPGVHSTYPGYADSLAERAVRAWTWASAHPDVTFYNASNGLAAGEQEVDEAGRLRKRLEAAVFLFELTKDPTYRAVFDGRHAIMSESFDAFHMDQLDVLLEYTMLSGAAPAVVAAIVHAYKEEVEGDAFFGAQRANRSPYLSFLSGYVWGSNQNVAEQGNMFAALATFGIDPPAAAESMQYAERYVHYIHGLNPLGLVYLTNMGNTGAERSVARLFHSWFASGSDWDAFGVSAFGPPPGFLVGGPNAYYQWDSCCPDHCRSSLKDILEGRGSTCGSAPLSPPAGQPPLKSFREFNDGWPLDSWQITEPDDGYQARYVRLLSKFVR